MKHLFSKGPQQFIFCGYCSSTADTDEKVDAVKPAMAIINGQSVCEDHAAYAAQYPNFMDGFMLVNAGLPVQPISEENN